MSEIDWPKKGDKLFTTDGGLYNACINWVHESEKQGLYARSFNSASLLLIDHVVENRDELDTFIYPIIYCFRHSLELTFKEIIKMGIDNWDKFGVQKIPHHHDLLKLWYLAKKVLINFFPDEDKSVLIHVENCIKEVDQLDRLSIAFRYPEGIDGVQCLQGVKYINTVNLRKTMRALSIFLEGIDGALSEMKNHINSNIAKEL